mgnify:CR=1 FL=1
MTTIKCIDRIDTEWGDRKESLTALTDTEVIEYPLSFDYVEADTFGDHDAYHRYQMSWGGPQDEIRFYEDNKVTYAFLDWYDHAEIEITDEAITKRIRSILWEFIQDIV